METTTLYLVLTAVLFFLFNIALFYQLGNEFYLTYRLIVDSLRDGYLDENEINKIYAQIGKLGKIALKINRKIYSNRNYRFNLYT